MSFNTKARRMRQSGKSFRQRRSCFLSCLVVYSQICHHSHRASYARFAEEFGFSDEETPDANERILRALDALEIERNQLLEQLRLFAIQRSKAKMRGQRNVSKAEQEKLDAIRDATQSKQKR